AHRVGQRAAHGLDVANIGAYAAHASPVRGQPFERCRDVLRASAHYGHVRALRGKRGGDAEVDAGGSSEHDHMPLVELQIDAHRGSGMKMSTTHEMPTHVYQGVCHNTGVTELSVAQQIDGAKCTAFMTTWST